MDYALLIYASEKHFDALPADTQGALIAAYGPYTREIAATGRMKPGAALMPTATATCVRVRDGKTLVTDGPFAETREQLGGFYVFSTDDPDEAIAWAAKIPDAVHGSVEVRPVPPMGPPASAAAGDKPAEASKEYLLLIYDDEKHLAEIPEAQRNAIYGRYFELSAELRRRGVFADGSALGSVSGAKTVRQRDGKRLVTDGPFAETREQLGGYYHVFAKDLDEAIAYAKKIPAVETGTIEIRPVMDTSTIV
jgi:hypothetical protein